LEVKIVRVVVQRPDLDTCLAGAILGAGEADEVVYRAEGALPEELANPEIVCLEAGGSGQIERRNFDHHGPGQALPPAATQAFVFAGRPAEYGPLVEYNEVIDLCLSSPAPPPFPSVSSLISGIRFVHASDPVRQFREGVAALRLIAQRGIDPFDRLPALACWDRYLEEKSRRQAELHSAPLAAEFVQCGTAKVAFLISELVGAVGALYRRGADVAVVARPLAEAGTWKHTIAGRQMRVAELLPALNRLEPGWGGPAHGTIIGSPWSGSTLAPETVRAVVLAGLKTQEGMNERQAELDR
jgi:hypothetical protein